MAVIEYDHNHPLFATIGEQPQLYRRHRYIAIHAWELTEQDEAVLREIRGVVFAYPFDVAALLAAIEEAAASLAADQV